MLRIKVEALSDIGKIRKNNEDNLFCNGIYKENVRAECFEYHGSAEAAGENIYAVFDGMGGISDGEEASLAAAQALDRYYRNLCGEQFDFSAAIQEMNTAICQKIRQFDSNMGSTAVLLSVNAGDIQIANIGDSRAYMYRDGSLVQLSKDHTKANSLLEMQELLGIDGEIDVSELKNVLSQHLGISNDEFIIEPEISEKIEREETDIYLLCSDGLTCCVPDEKIAAILAGEMELKSKLYLLKEEALSAGGRDNITIVLIERCDKSMI